MIPPKNRPSNRETHGALVTASPSEVTHLERRGENKRFADGVQQKNASRRLGEAEFGTLTPTLVD